MFRRFGPPIKYAQNTLDMNLSDLEVINPSTWRTAHSVAMSERVALKEGNQALYADPDSALDKYRDFDLVQEMMSRKGSKLLWVRARAIDADVVNANGDYFPKAELLKKVVHEGNKVPAYKTFEGVPIYTNHANKDITQAKGQVVYAEWDEKQNCVFVVFYVDEEAYPDIARGIRVGYMRDVSMGCQVESGKCSICDNEAQTEKEYCDHMRKYKGKTYPETGKKAYEVNFGIKFIELSIVGDGAFDMCSIEELYDQDELVQKAAELTKKAGAIQALVVTAQSKEWGSDPMFATAMDACMYRAASLSNTAMRLAQAPSNLVGGQILATGGANSNTTVAKIIEFLGIDSKTGLNILDLLNLALNFLEVAILNLFSKKDNVDLTHVQKVAKAMADLQGTMQDMIDDGIDVGGQAGQQGGVPLPQQGGAPQQTVPGPLTAPGQPQGQGADYTTSNGQVGRAMNPQQQGGMKVQPTAFSLGIGGGASASTKGTSRPMLVWADATSNKREVVAGVLDDDASTAERFGRSILTLASTLGITPANHQAFVRSAGGNNTNTRSGLPSQDVRGGGNTTMNKNEIAQRLANKLRERKADRVSYVANFEDDSKTHRVALSTDGTVQAFYGGEPIRWEPTLSENQIVLLENSQIDVVGQQILADFKGAVRTAQKAGRHPRDMEGPMNAELDDARTYEADDIFERQLDGSKERSGPREEHRELDLESARKKGLKYDETVLNQALDSDAGLYTWKGDLTKEIRDYLYTDARDDAPTEHIELRLQRARAQSRGESEPRDVVSNVLQALGRAVISGQSTPSEVREVVAKIAERKDIADLITLASIGTSKRNKIREKIAFHNLNSVRLTTEAAIYDELGAITDGKQITASDVVEVIRLASSQPEKTVAGITRIAKSLIDSGSRVSVDLGHRTAGFTDKLKVALDSVVSGPVEDKVNRSHLKASLMAMASTCEELVATPEEIVATIANTDKEVLAADIEAARTEDATEERLTRRSRHEFFGMNRFASKKDVYASLIGWLADYSNDAKFSTGLVVEAASRAASNPRAAEMLITKMLRTAGIEVTEEKLTTRRIVCRVEDCDGLDPKDDNFDHAFRDRAMQIFQNAGYTVDPQTFSISDLNVSADGTITASVSSRMTKTFSVEAGAQPGMDDQSSSNPIEVGDSVMTPRAAMARKEYRQYLAERTAQMGGGMGGGTGGQSGGPGQAAPAPDLASPPSDVPTTSALTVPTEGEGDDAGAPNSDSMPEPGKQLPWGTVCPICGSTDLTLANGEGKCNSCNTNLKFKFSVDASPPNSKDSGGTPPPAPEADAAGAGGEASALPGDVGLGAATAPGGGEASPGPMMAQASWEIEPDVFIRTGSQKYNRDRELKLPVGYVCPSCGNREASTLSKVKNRSYCYDCGTVAVSQVTESETPGRVACTITWMTA